MTPVEDIVIYFILTLLDEQVPLGTANLQLEVRFYGAPGSSTDDYQSSDAPPRFNLIFPMTLEERSAYGVPQWRELEIEHLEHSSEAPPACTPAGKTPNPVLTVDLAAELSIKNCVLGR